MALHSSEVVNRQAFLRSDDYPPTSGTLGNSNRLCDISRLVLLSILS
jgi:hypothetical protein